MNKFLFGDPPFDFLVRHLVKDEDFLKDSRRILDLDQDAFSRLATRLKNADVFLDRDTLGALATEVLGEGDETRDLTSSIYKIAGVLHSADKPVNEAMDRLGEAILEKAEGLQQAERSILVDRIRALAADPGGLAMQVKARKLVDATGSELDEFQIICDIRPIFDQEREQIEGVVPLTILRLDYSLPDGDSAVVEMRVTVKQIEEFELKLATVKRKLNSIKELAASRRLPIPKTKSTYMEEE